MKIDVVDVLAGDRLEEAWQLYLEAFSDLNAMTVQRHLMHRHEFDDVAGDLLVQKWLAVDDDGRIMGLSTYTNELQAMSLISPAYFERRWPELFAAGKIWYCGFVAVAQAKPRAFQLLVEGMYKVAQEVSGMISLDVCRYNIETRRMDRVIRLMLERIGGPGMVAETADQQTFFTYETNGWGDPPRSV